MKKALCYFVAIAMIIATLAIPTEKVQAYDANLSLGVSSSSVNIGDSVTVSVSVPGSASGPVSLYFPTDLLEFSSASTEVNVNGGTVQISIGTGGRAASNKVSVVFKTKAAGTASLSVAASGAIYDYDSLEEVNLSGASASVTIKNESIEEEKSGDNSLSSIKLSNGTLSPSFSSNVTKYKAKVGYNTTSITVSAKASHAKATIESITGNGTVALSVGENTIKIVVKAENGTKATYTIVVTREAESTEDESESESESQTESESESETESENVITLEDILKWNGEQYTLPENFSTDMMPEDFSQDSIFINNDEVPCFSYNKADLTVLCLENSNGAKVLFVYDATQQRIYPFVKILSERNYVMVLMPDETNAPAPAGTQACTFSIEGKGMVYAYQFVEIAEDGSTQSVSSDFYLVYCMNSDGKLGWYSYDAVEGTAQRYIVVNASGDSVATGSEGVVGTGDDLQTKYTALSAELATAKMIQMIAIIIAAVAVVLCIIVLILYFKKRSDEGFEDDEDDEDDEEYHDAEEKVKVEDIPEVTVEEEIAEEDEIEIEFYEMTKEESEVESLEDTSQNKQKNAPKNGKDGDDDIEFIEL